MSLGTSLCISSVRLSIWPIGVAKFVSKDPFSHHARLSGYLTAVHNFENLTNEGGAGGLGSLYIVYKDYTKLKKTRLCKAPYKTIKDIRY